MKNETILKTAANLNINPIVLKNDLQTLNLLSADTKNIINNILYTAGISVEKTLESYDTEKEEWLKLYNNDELLNTIKQQQQVKNDFIGLLINYLDYPVIE